MCACVCKYVVCVYIQLCVSLSTRVSVSVGVVVWLAASGCGCVTTLLAAAVITFLGCFSLSRDLFLALESCVLLGAAAGWDEDELALEERCWLWNLFGDRSVPLPLSGRDLEAVASFPLPS